jgi:hypothetical protein
MIKFFRKIRQNILMEKPTSNNLRAGKTASLGEASAKGVRYFKYAIGELLLVIAGILIAVSINGWNEDRKLRNEEQSLLKDLKQEMVFNYDALEKVIQQHQNSLQAAIEMRALYSDRDAFDKMTADEFGQIYTRMALNSTYDPQSGILNSLIYSGRLSLLSNKELKYSLASFKELTVDAFESTIEIQNQRPQLQNIYWMKAFVKEDGKILRYDPKSVFDHEAFRVYTNVHMYITRKQGLAEELLLKQELEKIINLIDQEIKK